MRRYLLLCLLLLPLFASPQQTRIEEQTITHTQAQQWRLTDSEWQRYQQLRQGERGIWSPGLDPSPPLVWKPTATPNASTSLSCWPVKNISGWRKSWRSSVPTTGHGSGFTQR